MAWWALTGIKHDQVVIFVLARQILPESLEIRCTGDDLPVAVWLASVTLWYCILTICHSYEGR